MMASLLTIAGAVAVALVIWVPGGGGDTTHAAGPTPPADCFVSDEPTAGGPVAPSDLEATVVFQSFFLANFELTWDDNSSDETCFVVERQDGNPLTSEFEMVVVLPVNTTTYVDGPYGHNEARQYRVYAANVSDRSDYSNEAHPVVPILEPTPTPKPQYLRGDLNCNGQIDPVDSLVVLREDAGLDPNLHPLCPSLHSLVQVTQPAIAAAGGALALLGLAAGVVAASRQTRSSSRRNAGVRGRPEADR